MAATVERLDEEVFVHNVGIGGLHVARMEHTFGHFLIVPGTPMRLPGRLAVDLMVPRAKGAAWLRHAIEEMGNLPNFLPRLYEREGGAGAQVPTPTGTGE